MTPVTFRNNHKLFIALALLAYTQTKMIHVDLCIEARNTAKTIQVTSKCIHIRANHVDMQKTASATLTFLLAHRFSPIKCKAKIECKGRLNESNECRKSDKANARQCKENQGHFALFHYFCLSLTFSLASNILICS